MSHVKRHSFLHALEIETSSYAKGAFLYYQNKINRTEKQCNVTLAKHNLSKLIQDWENSTKKPYSTTSRQAKYPCEVWSLWNSHLL